MQPFKLPEFYMPWPARLNPNLEAARVHSKAWAYSMGILDSPEEAQGEPIWDEHKFDSHDYALLCSYTRVADLYNEPMNQTEQQLRLTFEALRERQEHDLIDNREFGLLHNADLKQRIYTCSGPPTPDDLDELITRRRKPKFFLAHPRTIAAFSRECNRRGIYPPSIDMDGTKLITWRNVPILPCNKIPITKNQTSSILVLRTGEEDRGVIGLHQTGIPDEYQPGLSVRFMGINEKAIISYLVTAYYSAAVLVPDALGILEDVEIGR